MYICGWIHNCIHASWEIRKSDYYINMNLFVSRQVDEYEYLIKKKDLEKITKNNKLNC